MEKITLDAGKQWVALAIVVLLAGCTRDWSQYEQRDTGGAGGTNDGTGGTFEGAGGSYGGAGGESDPYCEPGEVDSCTCSDGTRGTRTCRPGGTYSECDCPPFFPPCVPSQTSPCVCDDGSSGWRLCLEDGFFGECVCSGSVCGNGIIEGLEQCDGANLNDATCSSLGGGRGNLSCTSRCSFDLSRCSGSGCGNGIIEGPEQCDGANLGGESCATLDSGSYGTLQCDPFTCTFDLSRCATGSTGGHGGSTAGSGGMICEDTCSGAYDGFCDDGGPGFAYAICDYGTDCTDCGPRP